MKKKMMEEVSYEVSKLNSAALYLQTLAEDLEHLDSDEQKLAEADLVMHIQRLILVCQKLRGVKVDAEKARRIIEQI